MFNKVSRCKLGPIRQSGASRSRQIPDGLRRLLDRDSKKSELSMMGKERERTQNALRGNVVLRAKWPSFLRTSGLVCSNQTTVRNCGFEKIVKNIIASKKSST